MAVNTTTWIIIAVAVVVLLAVIAIVVGLQLRKKRRITLSAPEEKKELTREQKSGNYQAGTGFAFTEAGGTVVGNTRAKEPVVRGGSATIDSPAPASPTTPQTPGTPATQTPGTPETPVTQTPGTPETPATTGDSPAPVTGSIPAGTQAPADGGTAVPAAGATAAPADGTPVETGETASAAPEHAPVTHDGATGDTTVVTAPEVSPVVVPPQTPSAEIPSPPVDRTAPVEQIDPATGRMDRLRGRLARSQSTVGQGLLGLLGAGDLDEDAWEEIEDTLIMADLGSTMTQKVVDRLREDIAANQVRTEEQVRELLKNALVDNLHPEYDRAIRALPNDGKPAVLLVVGVNGTGKTTTTGKLARVLVAQGRTVLLGAADTFRAAAADQLQTWGERVGAEIVRGKESADPASVAFDSVARGVETGVDAVLIDTAGRLHTKTGLMDQLGKVKRVVEKKATVDEVLLVIDATTGQNGLMQARVFKDVVDITGVVLTKLDGTAKGGIVFQVQHELGVPVKLVGLGEGADDLAPFTPEAFVKALLGY